MRVRPTSRPLARLLVSLTLGATALALTVPAAQADPSPTPAAPTPTASTAPVATPTESPSATPAPTATPSATASANRATTRSTRKPTAAQRWAGLRSALPAATRELVSSRLDTSSVRRALAGPDDFALVEGQCASGSAGTGGVEFGLSTGATTYRYVVTAPNGSTRTGAGTVRDGLADVTVNGLARGAYRVQVFTGTDTTAAVDEQVSVISCVTTTTACQSATFANPADNPAVFVIYADVESEDGEDAQFRLAAGARHTARIRSAAVGWAAVDEADLADVGSDYATVIVLTLAGAGRLAVPQDCQAPFLTRILTSCATGRTPTAARIEVRHDQEAPVRYEIRGRLSQAHPTGVVVVSGPLPAAGPADDTFDARLPGEGDYLWLAYVDDDPVAYETIDFRVYACVTVKVSCRSVTFVNPKRNGPVTVAYDPTTSMEKVIRLKAGASRTVTINRARIGWVAVPTSSYEQFRSGDLEVAALASASSTIAVPQDCTPPGVEASAGLADTGAGPGLAGAALLGLVLIGGGVALTRRRARV